MLDKYKGSTPGPWEIDLDAGGDNFIRAISDPSNTWVAMALTNKNRDANAKLIADSPVMLEYIKKKAAEGDSDAIKILEG